MNPVNKNLSTRPLGHVTSAKPQEAHTSFFNIPLATTSGEGSKSLPTSKKCLYLDLAQTQYSASGARLDNKGNFVQDRFPLLNRLMNFIRRAVGLTNNTISDKNIARYLQGAAQELKGHMVFLHKNTCIDDRRKYAMDLMAYYYQHPVHFAKHPKDVVELLRYVCLLDAELFQAWSSGNGVHISRSDGTAIGVKKLHCDSKFSQALAEEIAIESTTSKSDGGPGLLGKDVVENLLNEGFTIENILAISTAVISKKAIRDGVGKYNNGKILERQIDLRAPEIEKALNQRCSREVVIAQAHELLHVENRYVHGYVVKKVDKRNSKLSPDDFKNCDVVITLDNKCFYLNQITRKTTLLEHEWNLREGQKLSTWEVKRYLDAVDTPPVSGLKVRARTQVVRDNAGNILGYGVRPHGSRSIEEGETRKQDPVSGKPYFLRSTVPVASEERGGYKKLTGITPDRNTNTWGTRWKNEQEQTRVLAQARLAPGQLKAVELTNSPLDGRNSINFAGENENPTLRRVLAKYSHFVHTTRTDLNTVIAPKLERVLFSHLGREINSFNVAQYSGAVKDLDAAFTEHGFVHRDIKLENSGLDSKGNVCMFDFDMALTDTDFANNQKIKSAGSVPYVPCALYPLIEKPNCTTKQTARAQDVYAVLSTMLSHYIVVNHGDKLSGDYNLPGTYVCYAQKFSQLDAGGMSFLDKFIETAISNEHQEFVRQFLTCNDTHQMQHMLLPQIYNPEFPGRFLKISELLNCGSNSHLSV